MLKTKHLINLTVVALVLGLVSSALALQTKDRTSQGNNFGFQMRLGSSVFTGEHEYPRGSGNEILTYEGCWGHFGSCVRDIDGDGTMEDSSYGRSRGRTIPGQRGSLEAYAVVEEGHNAGHRLDQWMGRVENNEVWSSLDPDCIARWPAELREGRTASGEPILHGVETMCAMHTDAFNRSYHRNVPSTGVSMEYRFHFLNYAESNDLAFGHLFIRNMSEYLKWNDNPDFVAQVANTPDGQVWGEYCLIYVENYVAIGDDIQYPGYGRTDEGWAFHPEKQIKCMVDQDGLGKDFTLGGFAFILGYKSLRECSFNGETMQLANCNNMSWGAEFGFPKSVDIGTQSSSGWVHEWATAVKDGVEKDLSYGWFGGEISPWTGRPAIGVPGMLLPTDERFSQWLWGRGGRIDYTPWASIHDFGPRDTTSTDFAIMCCYPANPPMVMKPSSLEYIDDPELQANMAPMEHMGDVAKLVYAGGFVLPETPVPPSITIIPGDRQVTITWGNVNVNTPDAYYYFVQENPDVDPEGLYREYDFEGYKLYRSYVGPSDAHAELIYQCSLSDNNLSFYYIDTRDKDLSYSRLRNGMKAWYALVPYDRNWDAKIGEWFSLPADDQSKVWNRTAPEGYFTIRGRSDASNYRPAELGEVTYIGPATVPGPVAELSGDGNGKLTEDPKYLQPYLEFDLEVVNSERIQQDRTDYLECTGLDINWRWCRWADPKRELSLLNSSGNAMVVAPMFPTTNDIELFLNDTPTEDGVSYALAVQYDGEVHSYGGYGFVHQYVDLDTGGWTGGDLVPETRKCYPQGLGQQPAIGAYFRTGVFQMTWKAAGGGLSLDVQEKLSGSMIPFDPYIDNQGWGFMPADTYMDFYGEIEGGVAQADRENLMLEAVAADNTDNLGIWVNGFVMELKDVSAMPAAGVTFTFTYCLGEWNSDQTVFTQYADPPYPGDKWQINIKAMTMEPEDADLTQVKVVPNPYIASSVLDMSISSRRIEFINLPDKCTVRIYSLGGNLVNVLNHIGANRTGWGNFVDVDYIQPDNTPYEFQGYDNHSGTEAWNLKNRFGQTVASGLYFFHVTDSRGETYTGKFYIVN